MAKCYQCDMCGVVNILTPAPVRIPDDPDLFDSNEPDMVIYSKDKSYDICPVCSRKIMSLINRKKVMDSESI